TGKHSVSDTLSDDHDSLAIRFIAGVKVPSRKQRNTESLKVGISDRANFRFNLLPGRRNWITFDVETSSVATIQRKNVYSTCATHTRQCLYTFLQLIVKIDRLGVFFVFGCRKNDGHREKI